MKIVIFSILLAVVRASADDGDVSVSLSFSKLCQGKDVSDNGSCSKEAKEKMTEISNQIASIQASIASIQAQQSKIIERIVKQEKNNQLALEKALEKHLKSIVSTSHLAPIQPTAPLTTQTTSIPTSSELGLGFKETEDGIVVLKHDYTKHSTVFNDNGWNEYKSGFGKPEDENYWLGLENMHKLTSVGRWKLKVKIWGQSKDAEGEWESIAVASESDKYRLTVGKKISMTNLSRDPMLDNGGGGSMNGMAFTTRDNDNDEFSTRNCAKVFEGGWWFRDCYYMCLTCNSSKQKASMWIKQIEN